MPSRDSGRVGTDVAGARGARSAALAFIGAEQAELGPRVPRRVARQRAKSGGSWAASSGVGPLACFTRKPPPTRLPQCIPAARTSLAARGARHHPAGMFIVSEAEAAAIRTAFDRGGELSAAVELRRLFPGVTDNAQARECARISPDSRNQSTRGAIWPVALVPAAIWPGAVARAGVSTRRCMSARQFSFGWQGRGERTGNSGRSPSQDLAASPGQPLAWSDAYHALGDRYAYRGLRTCR
jgi:hypothetical protein